MGRRQQRAARRKPAGEASRLWDRIPILSVRPPTGLASCPTSRQENRRQSLFHRVWSGMTTAQTNEPAGRKPLRLWPGVLAVVLQWLAWIVLPMVVPEAALYGIVGGIVGGG